MGVNGFSASTGNDDTTRGLLKFVKFSETLTTIQSVAFRGDSLKQVIIPDNVTSLSQQRHFAYNQIKDIKLGKGLTYIGSSVFSNSDLAGEHDYPVRVNYLKEVFIPQNVIEIPTTVFATATPDVIIRTERTKEDFLASVTTMANDGEYSWRGQVQVISSDGLYIYE